MKILFVMFAVSTFLIGCSANGNEFGYLAIQEAYELIASGADVVILDVRSEEEFFSGHIEGAISLPVHEIEARMTDVLLDKNALILVICRSGSRSQTASQSLVDLGFTNVYDIGGIMSWPGDIVN